MGLELGVGMSWIDASVHLGKTGWAFGQLVTEQTWAGPPWGASVHDPTVSIEGSRFLFTGSHPVRAGGGVRWEHPCSEPCCPPSPSTPPASRQATSHTTPRGSLVFICSQAGLPTSLHPLRDVRRGRHSRRPLLQQRSPPASGVRCPQPPCSGPGNMCRVALHRGGV